MEDQFCPTGVSRGVGRAGASGGGGGSVGSLLFLCSSGRHGGNGGQDDVAPDCEAAEGQVDEGFRNRDVRSCEHDVGEGCERGGELDYECSVDFGEAGGQQSHHRLLLLWSTCLTLGQR